MKKMVAVMLAMVVVGLAGCGDSRTLQEKIVGEWVISGYEGPDAAEMIDTVNRYQMIHKFADDGTHVVSALNPASGRREVIEVGTWSMFSDELITKSSGILSKELREKVKVSGNKMELRQIGKEDCPMFFERRQ